MKTSMNNIKTYSELIRFDTFEERFNYLKLDAQIFDVTFGVDRYLNQKLYSSYKWKKLRDKIIIRDLGCDLGIKDREIHGRIMVHHMNPITKEDILDRSDFLLNPEYLITTVKRTHDAIHYGDDSLIIPTNIERRKNDTCPWKR